MVHCPELAGIFPPSARTLSPEERRPLQYADEEFLNYSSIEDSEYGEEVLGELVNSRFVDVFDDYDTACRHISAESLIYSKLALITTTKDGIIKHRLILDLRVSGCNDAATKVERIILPSAWDVVNNTMRVVARGGNSNDVSFFVCDFRDAFYMLPAHPDERRYLATKYKGIIYIWSSIAQGTINGPDTYGRLAALTNRMTQSLYEEEEMASEMYVDDPCLVLYGDVDRRAQMVSVVVLLWLILGWDLSYHKAQLTKAVAWVGYKIEAGKDEVKASIKEEFMQEFLEFTRRFGEETVVFVC